MELEIGCIISKRRRKKTLNGSNIERMFVFFFEDDINIEE